MRLRILLEPHHGATYAQILALAQAAEEGGFDAFFRSDHYLGIDADDTTYQPTDSWTTLAGPGRADRAGPARHPGQRVHVPAARAARGRGRDRRPDERRPGRARHRRRLVRAGAPVLRHPVPAARRAVRPARGAARDPHRHLGHQAGGAVQLRRQALPGARLRVDPALVEPGRRSSSAGPAPSGPRPWPRSTPTSSTARSASTCASGTPTSGGSARTSSAATRRRSGCRPPCRPASAGTPPTWSGARSRSASRAPACSRPASPATPAT